MVSARLGAGIHGRLEEAMGAAALGLGGVHREIGVLDQLIQIGAVLRRQRDADAGVGREMMAEALIGLPDRRRGCASRIPRRRRVPPTAVWITANSSPPSRAMRSARLEAILDAGRHGLQQLIADMVSERVVDALEFVDVDIEQRELLAAAAFSSSRSICSRNSTRFGRSVSAS